MKRKDFQLLFHGALARRAKDGNLRPPWGEKLKIGEIAEGAKRLFYSAGRMGETQ
jgi:hypothetical protein